jgi:3-deoxy-7-phosphoheptulonate synthase
MLVELAEMEVPTGSELLEINTAHYFLDLLSWGCIGARTSSSQPHRQMASSTPLPIGFKNTTDGNIANAINGVLSARSPHIFLGLHPTGQLGKIYAGGNAFAHLVLRGGEGAPNYHPPLVQKAMDQCHQAGINGRLFIDCSHGNSGKRMEMQVPVFQSVISQRMDGNQQIVGAMLESHLKAGSQGISTKLEYGISVTDPCLDWETTESLILEAYQK